MNNLKPISTRTFQKEGKWIERPHRSEVIVCSCGNKYIKTRNRQVTCITCMYKPLDTR